MTTAHDAAPTADEAFGLVVHEAMFRQRVTNVKLAAALGVHQTTVGKKLHGERPWTLDDMVAVSDALRIDLRDLLSEMWRDPMTPSGANGVEPLPRLDSNQQPFDYKSQPCDVIDLADFRIRYNKLNNLTADAVSNAV